MEAEGAGVLEGSSLLGGLPDEVRDALVARLVPHSLSGGEVLMRQGDAADGVHFVEAGRLQARLAVDDDHGGRVVVLGEIGRGEVVGEAALLTDQPRTATVVALRDTELWHLPVAAFEELVAEHPSFLRPVTAQVVRRMLAAGQRSGASQPVATVAVVPMHASGPASAGAAAVAEALAGVVGRATVVGPGDRPAGGSDAAWVQSLEADHDLVVFRCDAGDGDATPRFLRQSDVVVLVADAEQGPAATAVEAVLAAHREQVEVPVELVLVHPTWRDEPRGTSRWLEGREVRRHHHVRVGDDAHAGRVARLLTGRAIGVVLSGGGARSTAEIGVVRSMAQLGIPVDAVGGTSAGALVAGAFARGWSADQVRTALHEGMVAQGSPLDPTVPLTSLAAGRRMTERLQAAAGEVDIEDLWLPFYCVSTNLSRNRPEVHRRGRGWRAVRASMSIPGIFPPVAEGGDVLVDGGLVDNLPVAEMRRAHEGITVVAVDVGVHRGMDAGDLPDSTVVHGWRVLLDRLHPRRRSPQIAGILSILTRLTELGGGSVATDVGDVLVRPDVGRFPMLDFSRMDELIGVGEREGRVVLGEWWANREA
ncbi:MAG TPA: cyclic nucleotide-binding and patatin-like phospholipase domain-containing protein [Acidimicrobiales bacterium]|nr:cyclic nucleotide-binding and patatin-like phospholipase domain-containing protein [Acidimicrobiales bacterium]